jgi:hypothetical protein
MICKPIIVGDCIETAETLDPAGFWRQGRTLAITGRIVFVCRPVFPGTRCLGNWICFCPQMKRWETSTLLGLLSRTNPDHCTSYCHVPWVGCVNYKTWTWIYSLRITTTRFPNTWYTVALVTSWIRFWTRSELFSTALLLLRSESYRHTTGTHGVLTATNSFLYWLMTGTNFVSRPPYITSGWPNRKHRSSYCWGLPFLVALHPSGIVGESSVSMEVCLTCRCLATTSFAQTHHSMLV